MQVRFQASIFFIVDGIVWPELLAFDCLLIQAELCEVEFILKSGELRGINFDFSFKLSYFIWRLFLQNSNLPFIILMLLTVLTLPLSKRLFIFLYIPSQRSILIEKLIILRTLFNELIRQVQNLLISLFHDLFLLLLKIVKDLLILFFSVLPVLPVFFFKLHDLCLVLLLLYKQSIFF